MTTKGTDNKRIASVASRLRRSAEERGECICQSSSWPTDAPISRVGRKSKSKSNV